MKSLKSFMGFMDFDRMVARFRQFGGLRLVGVYVRMGVLWPILREVCRCALRGRSFKGVYDVVLKRVNPLLIEGYSGLMRERLKVLREGDCSEERSERVYVWWCWLQGIESAPELAKACLASLRRCLRGVEIVVVDERNYSEWCSLPEYVTRKYEEGRIPPAMFSDMLRLQLLATHGGVWIDSTVLCTMDAHKEGGKDSFHPSWEEIVRAELFVFQYTEPGKRWTGNISNWFIASRKGNPFVAVVRDMLFAYWRENDVVVNYYICHLFFAMVARELPEQVARMPYGWSRPCLELGLHLGDRFSQEKWDGFVSRFSWHKMSYRKVKGLMADRENYYHHILLL